MRKWEDIVREKMETFNDTLPESVFAEFQARRGGAAPVPAPKRFPPVWALVPAVAAVLAAALVLRRPADPDAGIGMIRQPAAPVVLAADSAKVSEPVPARPPIAAAVPRKAVVQPSVRAGEPEIAEAHPDGETAVPETGPASSPDAADDQGVREPVVTATSPGIPQVMPFRPVKMKVAPAAGIVAGGGLLAALLTPVIVPGTKSDAGPVNQADPAVVYAGTPVSAVGTAGKWTHCLPLKAGLSASIALSDRLRLTSGLEYAMYASRLQSSEGGEWRQFAHYLGIPLRLDWTLADSRWLDVYAGGGLEGDFCVGATLAGNRIGRDGFSLSLLGTGGVELHLTDHTGLYIEPGLSWTVPSAGQVLTTYRSEHPVMFSLAAGIRINLGN